METEEEMKERDLDTTTISMDKVALNNLVVSLRRTTKQVKTLTIYRLGKKIKKLRSKKGDEKTVNKGKRRADGLLEEVMAAKKVDIDEITKLALRNEKTFDDFAREPKSSVTDKATMRMCTHKLLVDKVENWRKQHSDWKELAEFLQTNVTRRIKNKKKKTPAKTSKKQLKQNKEADLEKRKSEESRKSVIENKNMKITEKEKSATVNDKTKNIKPSKNVKETKQVSKSHIQTETCDADIESSVVTSGDLIKTKSASMRQVPVSIESGFKVIRQLNLNDNECEEIHIGNVKHEGDDDDDEIPSVLMEDGVRTRTSGDSFFLGDEDSDVDSETEKKEYSDNSVVSDDDSESRIPRQAKHKMDSMFIGSLNFKSKSKLKAPRKEKVTSHSQRVSQGQVHRKNNLKIHKKDWNKSVKRSQGKEKFNKGPFREGKGSKSNQQHGSHRKRDWKGGTVKSHKGATHDRQGRSGQESKPHSKVKGQSHNKGFPDTKSNEVLHPSWEASKKRKQEQGALTAFSGKKITFDD